MMKIICLLALFASAAAQDAAEDKPTLKDYKDGKAKAAKEEAAKAANEAKMGAVNKVISMLETLQDAVKKEGEEEAKMHAAHCRFCETMTKKMSPQVGKDAQAVTGDKATIALLVTDEETLTSDVQTNEGELKKLTAARAAAKAANDKAIHTHVKNSEDLISGLKGVSDAIKVLKAGKSASLLQIQEMSTTVHTALMLADALGLTAGASASQAQLFLQKTAQAPAVEQENFKFHSEGIISTLETLQGQFREQKNTLDTDEAERKSAYELAQQKNADDYKAQATDMGNNKQTLDSKTAEHSRQTQTFLTPDTSNLADDTKFLAELTAGCKAKADTYKQRNELRAKELVALTQATTIIKTTVAAKTGSATVRLAQVASNLHVADAVAQDDESMEALEAEAEGEEVASPAMGFLQKRAVKSHSPESKAAVAALLKTKGLQLKSAALLSLVGEINADPFEKIKGLIQGMIEKLLKEASTEANTKGYCDKAQGDASQKREYAARQIDEDTANMAKLEAEQERLVQNKKVLDKDVAALKADVTEATGLRGTEKTDNENAVKEANEGLAAVKEATQIISRFYATAAKEEVTPSANFMEGSFDEPGTGFKSGEAYKGKADASAGIVGMMEVIAGDFTRTVESTKIAEADAVSAHRDFMIEATTSINEKELLLTENTKFKGETDEKHQAATDSKKAQTTLRDSAEGQLEALKGTCKPKGQSAADRKAMRKDEIASLNNALELLSA